MTHTYRDPDVLKGRFDRLSALAPCAFVVLFFVGWMAIGGAPFSWTWAGVAGVVCAFVFFMMYAGYRKGSYGTCGEIRLGGDGTCEFETKRRVIRLHVHDLRSVRYSPKTSEQVESYTIHYRTEKLHVRKQMTGFADFLTRLKTLNPAVDLNSFPADAWPDLGQPAQQERGSVGGLKRSVLIPLCVIVVLVYTAQQTLVK